MARSVGITREQLVSVAAELADAHGLDGFTLAQVAARLQVKLPSLYNHVTGLAGLRRELAILGVRQIGERIARAAIGKSGDEAVLALAQAYRGFVLERPGLYAAGVPAPNPDDAEHLALARDVIEIILAVLAPYHLDEDSAIHAVRGLRAITHGFATIEHAGGFGLALDRDESFLRLVRGYIAGLRGGA
jgi:AcrR family transcriptional regulator